MLFKNAIQKCHVYAYDSTTGAAKTGDALNITAYVSLDGTANAIDDTNPAEVDATNMPGVYVFDLTAAETNCDSFALVAKSGTANIRCVPIIGFTNAGAVPKLTPGAAGGLFIAGSNAATTVASWTCTAAFTNGSTVLGNMTVGTLAVGALTQTGAATLGVGSTVTLATLAVTGALSAGSTALGNTTIGTLEIGALTQTGAASLGVGSTVTFAALTVTAAMTVGTNAIPWNAAWDAEVQSECIDAFNAYDPPTNAEMVARTLVASGYASPTNITAGTITTVTNLTNLPSIPNNWITAAGIQAGAITNATFAADVGSTAYATNIIALAADKAIVNHNLDHIAGTPTGIPALPAGTWLDILRSDGSATYDRTTDSLQAIRDTAPLGTAMRGTDNAALASVVGALADAAADGDPTTADTVMQYVKQLVNTLVGTAGIPTFPAEAAPGNAVSLAEVLRAIAADVTGLNGDVMRGTDGAYTGTPPTTAAIVTALLTDLLASTNFNTASSFGKLIKDYLDAAISTRSTLVAGAQMDLVNAPNSTAVTAIQAGLATTTELNKVPKSDGTSSWNATALAALQSEANDALQTWGKTGFSLAAAGLDSVVVETGLNARQAMSIIASAVAGILAGAATATVTIKAAQEGATTRITATCDSDGNRSAVTLSLPT